jgi:hypothetical protein
MKQMQLIKGRTGTYFEGEGISVTGPRLKVISVRKLNERSEKRARAAENEVIVS